jgi:class 3 adenylate cyclase
MDAPQIRYARTRDGVNLAYWAVGSGPVLVIIDLPTSNVQFEWNQPGSRLFYQPVTRIAKLVRYDHRGFGLSDRVDGEFTTDAFVRDLEAVLDRVGDAPVFLIASRGPTYPIALEFARLHPERVVRIAVLIGGPPDDFVPGILDAPGVDWDFIVEATSRRIAGWNDEDAATELAAFIRHSMDESGLRRFVRWFSAAAAPTRLDEIATPCLFLPLNVGGADWIDRARALASQMPEGRVQPVTGADNRERMIRANAAITSFFAEALGGDASAVPRPTLSAGDTLSSRAAVVLFTDIADSTAMTERLGDGRFRDASRALDAALRDAIRESGGSAVEGKRVADGVMAVFASARDAIAAALKCREFSAASELTLHIGLHAGDVIRESGNVFGGTVNIAARICDASAPGEILVSDVVRGMARTSAGVTFEDRDERERKGVGEPVRVYAVRSGDA